MNSYIKNIYLKGEDRHFVRDEPEFQLFGVADGHGGYDAAEICRENINSMDDISDLKDFSENIMTDKLIKLFEKLHKKCLKNSASSSGCTLTIVLVHKESRQYVCANVGDSHAIHIKPTTFLWITNSHRLQDNATERQRLKSHVSYIVEDGVKIGPPRLFPGGLSCSRSIGDSDCTHILCKPSVYFDKLDYDDSIVLCTDGIWDHVQIPKLITITKTTYNPEFLCRLATKKGCFDDCTAIIITRQKCKTSIHTGLFHLFSRNNSMSSEDDSSPPSTPAKIILKVPSLDLSNSR